jgi:hypothetical protein
MPAELKELFKNLSFTTVMVMIGVMVICLLTSVFLEIYNHWSAYYLLLSPTINYVYENWKIFVAIIPVLIIWNLIFCSRIPQEHHYSKILGFFGAILTTLYVGFVALSYSLVYTYNAESNDYGLSFIAMFFTIFISLNFLKCIFLEFKQVKSAGFID